ncbi:MAG: DUF4162 domain-containing protein, partial [Thermoplasmata archaeon]|nr:DUF4162 domain-containing protein [Thermoplasmata archaeon]
VQALCDRVGIINKGKLIAEDTVENLSEHLHIRPHLEIVIPGLDSEVPDFLQTIKKVESVHTNGDTLFVTCEHEARMKVITKLKEKGYEIQDFQTFEPTLEETFIKLISEAEGGE